ncbi:unnamed protein product [Heligmosomoides polygyrus]|uniref:Class I SAM-dependent DNA methyltransferase n=1 Tax=Heligmosomoides polygyrus TaxID=6339 RepID=A0A183FNT3_HELPZ|nr:unnamed protein product [Heligmosomoides polygyrus]
MAEIQAYKARITNACGLIKSSEPEVNRLDQAFAFPEEGKDCDAYIREKTAQLNHLMKTVISNKQYHDNWRPLFEGPTFSGDFREFNAFWSVFQALIHNDAGSTDQEKFLFLKQALKGQAAASIT